MSIIKTIRKYYWLIEAFAKRHYKTVLIATIGGTFILGASIFLLQYIPSYKKSLRIGQIGKYTTKNLPLDILNLISQGLVQATPTGDFAPALAKSWSISEDGLVYTFAIDTSQKWHNGQSLTPESISYNFKEVTQQIDGDKLIYTLHEPFSPFLSALTKPLLINNKFGVGNYKISKLKEYGGGIQTLTISSPSHIITYKFYPTESSAITAYKLGEIDQINNISYVPEEISKEPQNILSSNQKDGKITVLFFNNNDAILSSKSTRQALAYAIKDKSFGRERVLNPISSNSWAYNDLVKTYDYDKEKSNNLLNTDINDKSSVKLELKTMLQYLEVAEQVASDWRETLGIEVSVKVVTGITTDYQILLADYAPPIDPDQYSIWHSTQDTNFTHYQNLKVDKLLEDGRRTLDKKLRKEIYQDFQRFLIEDCPAVFLFETSSTTITRRGLFN